MIGAPLFWIASALFEAWLVASDTADVSDEIVYIAPLHLALTVVLLAIFSWWRAHGRLTARRLMSINAAWIVSFLALVAFASKLMSFGSLESAPATSGLTTAAAILGVFGIVVRIEKDWSLVSDRHVALYVAWGGAFIAILMADQIDTTWQLEHNRAVQVFEGMFTLGVPLAIHQAIARRYPAAKRVPVLVHLAWFVAGLFVAFLLMSIEHADWRWLFFALPIWTLLLAAARAWQRSSDRLSSAMAGTMLAAGTTLYWRLPQVFSVPFRPAIPSVETITLWYEERRSLDPAMALAITLVGIALGALCGLMVGATATSSGRAPSG